MYSNGHVVVDKCMFADQEKRDATNTLVEAACPEKCKQKCKQQFPLTALKLVRTLRHVHYTKVNTMR